MNKTEIDADERFTFEFANGVADDSGSLTLEDAELQTMGAVGSCVLQLKNLLPKTLASKVDLIGGAIHLILSLAEDAPQEPLLSDIPEQTMILIANLDSTVSKARENSRSEKPLPLSQVGPDRAYMTFQQSVARATASTGLRISARVAGKEQSLMQATMEDFSAGREQVKKSKRVNMTVVGLVRDDKKGHVLLLSSEEVRVQLPIDDWPWSRIRAALDLKTIFSGTIEKHDIGEPWIATADASLSQQEDAFVTEIDANDGDD